jgi:hypothetical protein
MRIAPLATNCAVSAAACAAAVMSFGLGTFGLMPSTIPHSEPAVCALRYTGAQEGDE